MHRFADLDAVIDPQEGGRRLSYAGLLDEADTAAAALIERGVQPGDRVALWAPNTWEWVVASLGVMFSGGVLVPINTRLRGYEAAHALAIRGQSIYCNDSSVSLVELSRLRTFPTADIFILRATPGCLTTHLRRIRTASIPTRRRSHVARHTRDPFPRPTGDPKGHLPTSSSFTSRTSRLGPP